MQNAALYHRCVVLPLDATALEELYSWDVSPSTHVSLARLRPERVFYAFWRTGIFDAINARCGTLIDDAEEEIIQPDQLMAAAGAIDQKLPEIESEDLAGLAREIRDLCRCGHEIGMPVFFVF